MESWCTNATAKNEVISFQCFRFDRLSMQSESTLPVREERQAYLKTANRRGAWGGSGKSRSDCRSANRSWGGLERIDMHFWSWEKGNSTEDSRFTTGGALAVIKVRSLW